MYTLSTPYSQESRTAYVLTTTEALDALIAETASAANDDTPPDALSIEREFSAPENAQNSLINKASEARSDEPALVSNYTPVSPTPSASPTPSSTPTQTPTQTPTTQSTKNSGAASLTITTTSTTPSGRKVRSTVHASVGATPWRTFSDDQVFRLACRNVAARGGLALSLNFSPAIARKTVLAACPTTFIAARINAELRKIGHAATELGFRFEVSRENKLHIHGFGLFDELADPAQITAALRRAGGKFTGPALMTQGHVQDITDADGWTDYASKSADRRRAEALLPGKALAYVSRAARAAAKAAHEGLRPKKPRTRRTVPAPVPAPATPCKTTPATVTPHKVTPAPATPYKAPQRPAMRPVVVTPPKTHKTPLRPAPTAPVRHLLRTVCTHCRPCTAHRNTHAPPRLYALGNKR